MKRLISLLVCFVAAPLFGAPVEIIRDVSYCSGAEADAYRHKLDLFLPQGVTKFPTVVFVHGGGWSMGSKDGFLALPGHKAADHGKFFATQGIAAVHVNYRLAPRAKHPEHIEDVAKAFAWVRQNIAQYGGDPDQLFVMGHSAGGHLAALLASDPRYLMAEGLTPGAIRGVIPVSGVFILSSDLAPAGLVDKPTNAAGIFGHVFGQDPIVYKQASPIAHIRPKMPPFLVAYADRDMPTLPLQAVTFSEVLAAKGNDVHKLLVTGRSHQSILKNSLQSGDPLGEAILSFVRTGKP